MCKAVEDMIKEEREEERKESAIRMLKDGTLTYEKIAEYSNLPLEVIKELATSLNETKNLTADN